jgi:hypothetical protein
MPRSLVLQFGIALHSHGFGSTLRGSSWVCPLPLLQSIHASKLCSARILPPVDRNISDVYPVKTNLYCGRR